MAGETVHDDIIVFEVMSEQVDVTRWHSYRLHLDKVFRQDTIIRASAVTLL